MNLYEITIKPISGFGTPLKGDTIFGHFCWQAVHDSDLLTGGLEKNIADYAEKPFAIFSSAFPKSESCYFLKRPDMPLNLIFPSEDQDKEKFHDDLKKNKKKKWMKIKENLMIDISKGEFWADKELVERFFRQLPQEIQRQIKNPEELSDVVMPFSQPHNSINRLTNTTGSSEFAPYSSENFYYYPETELALFVLIDESVTGIQKISKALENIGKWGFGRDASTGMGRFEVREFKKLKIPNIENADACYTLAPCVPEKDSFEKAYFTPFTRFGKHGNRLANSKNPFKNPVLMADEGAVFKPKDKSFFEKPYMGKAVTNVSKSMPNAVVQGYTPYLPLKMPKE